ncbi:MAG: hypothetical protein L3J74_02110 [Bacteroidales bacterium]|nr:hypothetical protein [Bacteroidales bacterium]
MKYTEIAIDQNKIEFHNSILGVEKIIFNGKKVSKKFSFLGTTHNFKVGEDDFKISSKSRPFSWNNLKIIIERNNEKIYDKNISTNIKHRIIWFVIGLVIGMLIVQIDF